MTRFFVIDRTWKQTLLIKQICVAFKVRPLVSQTYNLQRLKMKSNITWVTSYALNFKIIAFFRFFFEIFLEEGALKI